MMNKKASGEVWWIIIGAVAAIFVLIIVLTIVKDGLSRGKDDVVFLQSCKNQGGKCEKNCGGNEEGFYRSGGCPDDGDAATDDVNCCIPKS